MTAPGPIAIFPWGDVVEEFLGPLGLSLDDYVRRMRGGWLFGYVAALQGAGRPCVVVHASEQVTAPRRMEHADTGAPVWFVPGRRTGAGRTAGRPSLRAAVQWARTPFGAFSRVLKQERCAGVLVQDYEHPRFDALAALAAMHRLPLLAAFQGGDVTLSPLEARARRASLSRCRRVIVASARERERLSATYGIGERLLDIPNPVDLGFWTPEPRLQVRRALGIGEDELLVVNHGRIDIHRKGLDLMIDAWGRFRREHPNARFVIIGSGQDDQRFAALASSVQGVRWLSSYVTDPPFIRRWLSAADIYMTLSRIEGMPVAPLEAMACGLPVVASDAHGLADIFHREAGGGLVVAGGEPAEAALALGRLARDGALRRTLGNEARRRVESAYGLGSVGAALAAAVGPITPRVQGEAAAPAASSTHISDIAS